jgi:hypothetical protein
MPPPHRFPSALIMKPSAVAASLSYIKRIKIGWLRLARAGSTFARAALRPHNLGGHAQALGDFTRAAVGPNSISRYE